MTDQRYARATAAQDFRRLRGRAALGAIIARLTGKSDGLLSFEDVRNKLKAHTMISRGLRDISLDAIVGSVGRYTDFSRSFLPLKDTDSARWTRVKTGVTALGGLPPIEVYQIGDAYFVLDGNHRVSVARELGNTHIEAFVTEVQTRVPLSIHVTPDELIIKAEHAAFLDQTHLDEVRPDSNLSVTAPGQYGALEAQIDAHRQNVSREQGRDLTLDQAAGDWYDTTYLPVVQVIRERGLQHDFPGRTETDLYVWISEQRDALRQELGWQVDPAIAVTDLVNQHSPRPERVVARLGEWLLETIRPGTFAPGPPPGQWRRDLGGDPLSERLFDDMLVPISGEEIGWNALEQALVVARYEGGRLHGLHVVPSEAQRSSAITTALRAEFQRRCAAAGVAGQLLIEVGGVTEQICSRSRWTDLVVVNLAHPPGLQPLDRLNSGFRALIQRCPRPVLAAPGKSSALSRALLAYDGSLKAQEALFVATYVALCWKLELTVITISDDESAGDVLLAQARTYLEDHGAQATFVRESGPVAATILKLVKSTASDLIIIGGYGFRPELEVVLGSAVDEVLRTSRTPMLICR